MFNIISGNWKISNRHIAELKKETTEISQSIEHTENFLEDMVQRVEEYLVHIASHAQEMCYFQLDSSFIADKLIDLEDRSRWNNLRVDSIEERPHQLWEDCERELDKFFLEGRGIEGELIIERVQRLKNREEIEK